MSSSAVTGPRKRFKDKKRKKESITEITAAANTQDNLTTKLVADETIHIQKEVKFGGNICSKLVFVAFLVALTAVMLLILTEYNRSKVENSDKQLSWLTNLFHFNYFTDDEIEQVLYNENIPESQPEGHSLIDKFWEILQFNYDSKMSESSINEKLKIERGQDHKFNENNDDKLNEDDEETADTYDDKKSANDEENYDTYDNNNENDADEDDDSDESEATKHDTSAITDNYEDLNDNSEYSSEESKNKDEDENDRISDLKAEDSFNRFSYYNGRHKIKYGDKYRNDDEWSDDKEMESNSYWKDADDEPDDSSEEDNSERPNDVENSIKLVAQETEDVQKDENNVMEDKDQNMAMKLIVGTALIFVAYAVIIRKWNHYVNQVNEYEEIINAIDTEQTNIENTANHKSNSENDFVKRDQYPDENETLQEYSETSTASESEDSTNTSGDDILAREIDDSKSEVSDTNSETNDFERESNSAFDRHSYKDYDKANTTNKLDWRYNDELDEADDDLENGRLIEALQKYREILKHDERSVRAKYGIAKSLDMKAELEKSNSLLVQAIEAYKDTLLSSDIPEASFKLIAARITNRMRFKGDYLNCIEMQKKFIEKYPNEITFRNELVVSYLTLNRISEAKEILEKILYKWPDNGLAMVHYGFVLKMIDKLPEAVDYLYKGIKTNENRTQDSRFYYHLGDALQRLKRNDEAMKVYDEGVERNMFLSKYQRSLYNVDRLSARPWWSVEQTTYQAFFRSLEKQWKIIRDEILTLLKHEKKSVFLEESEKLREIGDWKQFEIFSKGNRKPECNKVPVTCRLISNFPPAGSCRRGQAKFSVMEPGTHVWPHCGPTNCRLRAHLGLIIPANVSIRVADETRNWKEGEVMIFDDSFEHEVWHNGTSLRLILIVDVWHPELTVHERKTLTPI